MSAGDEVTLGEVARTLDRGLKEIKDSLAELKSTTVTREVYEIDRKATNRRLDEHDEDIKALATTRRQTLYALLTVGGAVVAAIVGPLAAGGHL